MIVAVDGLMQEKFGIVLNLVLAVVFFALGNIAYFWLIMSTSMAILSTLVSVIGFGYWYYYCSRIINRFKWTDKMIVWEDSDNIGVENTPNKNRLPAAEGIYVLLR